MKCIEYIDLTKGTTMKILGFYFSYNKKLEQEKSLLSHIVKIQNIFELWKLKNLTIDGRVAAFK